jgi:hypothetical protein
MVSTPPFLFVDGVVLADPSLLVPSSPGTAAPGASSGAQQAGQTPGPSGQPAGQASTQQAAAGQGQGAAGDAAVVAAAAAQMATLTVAMGHSLENAGAGTRPGTAVDMVRWYCYK